MPSLALRLEPLVASFCLVFLTELFDKTFWIIAVHGQKFGFTKALVGATCSFTVMTLIDIFTGAAISYYLNMALLQLLVGLTFGFLGASSLIELLEPAQSGDEGESKNLTSNCNVEQAIKPKQRWYNEIIIIFLSVFFLEIGDKSQLSILSMAATYDAINIGLGATLGFFVTTVLALISQKILTRKLSSKTINLLVIASLFYASALSLIQAYNSRHSITKYFT